MRPHGKDTGAHISKKWQSFILPKYVSHNKI